MKEKKITRKILSSFQKYLLEDEKASATVEKYLRDAMAFQAYVGDDGIAKDTVIAYKTALAENGYAPRSINSMLASLHKLFDFLGWSDCKVRTVRLQQQVFCSESRELTKAEYERLCRTAKRKHNERLCLILQTLCGTGLRVSELPFITVEAVRRGEATVSLKGKTRNVFLVRELQKKLLQYISAQGITGGMVFVTRTGKPVNRTNIWREMKNLCAEAEVNPEKVFPHNLRHLFARVFYSIEKDIAKLADLLGHSSIETTRIYIISSGREHRKLLETMRLVR